MDGHFEQEIKTRGYQLIIGVDEAGRGPLAGPVVAAAVSVKDNQFSAKIGDSKSLSASQREEAFYEIYEKAAVGVGIISEAVIDRSNILDATFLAMTNAVENLVNRLVSRQGQPQKVCLLIDGHLFRSELPYAYQTVVQGDKHVLSIACASIVAKVTRDRILGMYDQLYPQYGFGQHKGYATEQHRRAIGKHGYSLIHRRSFKSDIPLEQTP